MSICVGKADRGRLMCSMKIILLALSLMLANVSAFISLSFSSRQFAGVNQFPHSHLNAMATEQEMENFFDANHQWTPLFKSLLVSSDAPASVLLGGFESGLIPDPSDASPWKERPIVPSDEDDKKVVGSFLDTMHKFLLDIPVTEGENTSSDDLFIEEGRRVLMIGRYRVLREGAGEDKLFDYCWSEIAELVRAGTANNGSIILTPSFEGCLQSFCDNNILAPLSWLGIEEDMEVTSMASSNTGVRLIHKLQEVPQEPPTKEPLFGPSEKGPSKGFGKKK